MKMSGNLNESKRIESVQSERNAKEENKAKRNYGYTGEFRVTVTLPAIPLSVSNVHSKVQIWDSRDSLTRHLGTCRWGLHLKIVVRKAGN